MYRRLLLVASLALALAGCVTVANTLPPDQLAGMRLAGVTVAYATGARVWWGDGERAYAAMKGVAAHDSDTVSNTPEGQAYLRNTIAVKVKQAMTRHLAGELTGSRPVRVEVGVRDVRITSAIQRILVGGGHTMAADVNLVDTRTGQVLLAYPAQTAAAAAGEGLLGAMVDHAVMNEPIDRVIDNYASQYSRWLVRK